MTKKNSQRERALTVYFSTAKEKQDFVKQAGEFGFTASYLGLLAVYRALECGLIGELQQVMPSVGMGVKSASASTEVIPHSRKKTKTQSERRPTKSPVKG